MLNAPQALLNLDDLARILFIPGDDFFSNRNNSLIYLMLIKHTNIPIKILLTVNFSSRLPVAIDLSINMDDKLKQVEDRLIRSICKESELLLDAHPNLRSSAAQRMDALLDVLHKLRRTTIRGCCHGINHSLNCHSDLTDNSVRQ
jgi:hypothetical protein